MIQIYMTGEYSFSLIFPLAYKSRVNANFFLGEYCCAFSSVASAYVNDMRIILTWASMKKLPSKVVVRVEFLFCFACDPLWRNRSLVGKEIVYT